MNNAKRKLSGFFLGSLVILIVPVGLASTSPTTAPTGDTRSATQPTSLAEQATLRRGEQIREVLRDMLEESCLNHGEWPERLAPGGPKLVYLKPEKMADNPASESLARAVLRADVTVVLYEPIEENPAGIWVGYADGHLEFAPSAADLLACENQRLIVRDAPVDAATQPAPTGGEFKLRIFDPQGQPVEGAEVGTYADFDNIHPQLCHLSFANSDRPTISNEHGEATIAATTAFDAKFTEQPSVPIYILQKKRGLIAQFDLQRSDFGQTQIRELRLSPACHVHGQLSSVGLIAAGENLTWTNAILFKPGQLRFYTLDFTSNRQAFDFSLPSGDYGVQAYGTDCDSVFHYIHIEPGERDLNLQLDLPPDTITQLIGRPAPELRNIKGWEHGSPVKLADLRGKVVLLDFWGYWCGACVDSMPALMKLHDEFKDKGLVIIAVHDDSADSIEDLDRKLEKVRQEPWAGWGGRDLPFRIALDGGGPTRIKYSITTERGATTAAYGVHAFPTTVAIGRDGRTVGTVEVHSPQVRSDIQKLLAE